MAPTLKTPGPADPTPLAAATNKAAGPDSVGGAAARAVIG